MLLPVSVHALIRLFLIYLKKDATYAEVSAVINVEIHLYGAVLDC